MHGKKAFIIFCLKLLAYLLLIFLLLLNWVKRKAIRKTSLGTIKYNSSEAINLQIKHMVVRSVLFLPSLYLPTYCGDGLLEVPGSSWRRERLELGSQESWSSSAVPALFQAFPTLIVAKSKPFIALIEFGTTQTSGVEKNYKGRESCGMAERAQGAPAAQPRIWHHSHSHTRDILTAVLSQAARYKITESRGFTQSAAMERICARICGFGELANTFI